MSIRLKLNHEEGLRLRQQSAHTVEKPQLNEAGEPVPDAPPKKVKEWRFDKFQFPNGETTDECQQDEDPRRVGNDGKKLKLGTYTLHVTAGSRNLVIERKGKVASYNFKNEALRNQMRLKMQTLEKTGRKHQGKEVYEWRDSGLPQYVAPNTFCGVHVGDNQRAIVDEMPT